MASIIPSLVSDASNLILTFCDAGSLIQFSGVNREAYQNLSNGEFFKERYSDRHPHLKPFGKLFTMLRSTHPSNCWKVVCEILDPDWLRKGFNIYSSDNRFAEKVSPAFINEAIPHVLAALNEEKKRWKDKYRNICGDYYADPNSSIHKAWKKYKESIPLARRANLDVYKSLENQRKKCEFNIEQINEQIAGFLKFPESIHMLDLTREWEKGLQLEQALENKPLMENCCGLLNHLITHPEEKDPAALEEIRRSINACTDEYRIGIWKGLYDKCADKVIEDSWAEHHFQDFLPQLERVVGDQLEYAKYKISVSERFN